MVYYITSLPVFASTNRSTNDQIIIFTFHHSVCDLFAYLGKGGFPAGLDMFLHPNATLGSRYMQITNLVTLVFVCVIYLNLGPRS